VKKNKQNYWSAAQEAAIIQYQQASTRSEQSRIYNQHLKRPLNQLIESILFRYCSLTTSLNARELKDDTLAHLLLNIHKFRQEKGTKAYSYLGNMARNFLWDEIKRHNKRQGRREGIMQDDGTINQVLEYQTRYIQSHYLSEQDQDMLKQEELSVSGYLETLLLNFLLEEGHDYETVEKYLSWYFYKEDPAYKEIDRYHLTHQNIHSRFLRQLKKEGVIDAEQEYVSRMRKTKKITLNKAAMN
jgi:DNA-directed RNA polymerase specialized sigma24 family protein